MSETPSTGGNVFLRRPVTAIVISIVILMVGTLAIMNMPISQYPDITPPTVQITSNFTGADAQTVEQTTTTPIESQVNGVPGITYMQSNSANSGQSSITATLDLAANPNIVALDIQNRVGIATPTLPSQVQRLGVTTLKRNPSILMLVAIYSPGGSHSIPFMDNYANIYVRDQLLRVPGVGDVFSRADNFSMRVWLQPDKLAQMGLTANDVQNAINEQNLQIAAGSVGAPPQNSGSAFEFTVFTNSRLNTEADFGNIVVRSNPADKSIVYLKDVARIQLGKVSYSANSFVDGKRGAYLLVYQAPGSNALETAEGVYAAMDKMKKYFPADIDYVVPFESVTVVKVSISDVVNTLLIALLLVTIVVFLFLQNWRATLIPVLAIPVSIVGTFIFFIPLGFTINTLTMFGFVLAIGIVVDDAIVVVEAVQHYMDSEGLSPKEATARALADISAPVIAIALILASVFVPVGFIPGIVGKLYQQFAITIAISVLISAFVALSLTPALCSLLLKPQHLSNKSKGLNRFFFAFDSRLAKITNGYTSSVGKWIKKAPLVVILLICIIVGDLLLFKAKPTGFIPTEDDGRLICTFEIPEAGSTTRSINVLDSMIKLAQTVPGVYHTAALGGLNFLTGGAKSSSGSMFMQLKPWDERTKESEKIDGIVAELNKRFASIKEARIVVIKPPAIPGLGNAGGFSIQIEQRQSNDDIKTFEKVVNNFVAEVKKQPEIDKSPQGAFTFFSARTPGYIVNVDRDKCKTLGLNLADVYNTMQMYMGGTYINQFTAYGRNFYVVAQADTSYRSDVSKIGQYYVKNISGEMIPLSAVVSYKLTETAPLVSHFNLYRSAEVDGSAAPGYSSGQALDALERVADKVLPEGYGYEFSGLSLQEKKSGSSSAYIFALSVVFVFLFLAALYESWAVPFSVLLAVPIGVLGAIIALTLIPRLSNNVYAQIGLITLIGLSAKNAILIVEFAKERLDKGMSAADAALESVRLRLRPILMTSIAFILGVLPLALASGASSVARNTIGWTVLGGMIAATSLAIFVVPVLFVVIANIANRKKKTVQLDDAKELKDI
ncbi:efflux RND transporter permease subunit [Ferruginibacter albus]|uniref:efflux RND transporter permease subunit n=1 Tax=Ferruginibacter albus TaxID=2875540 RepID=UPI001CC34FEB|nr:multidrug efflux RND transporter permease subunit [Ferruginibacter albus]UAY50630.1 multidrug efflux RND transporter permease subunit [Ferruginibacter albus]